MRARTVLTLCCFVALLMVGAVLSAEPVPSPVVPALTAPDAAGPAPVCAAAKADLGNPGTAASCPASVWQSCYQRYGSCTLCYCIGSSCYCENRCV